MIVEVQFIFYRLPGNIRPQFAFPAPASVPDSTAINNDLVGPRLI